MSQNTHFMAATVEQKDAVLIKAIGPCSLTCCASLKKYLSQFRKPATTNIYFDLSEAESIDSTFAGFLLSLATKKSNPLMPDLYLVKPSERVSEAIRTMHIGAFLRTIPECPVAATKWQDVAFEREECDALRETVIDAHEKLIDADARNEKEFGRVVEGLREKKNDKS